MEYKAIYKCRLCSEAYSNLKAGAELVEQSMLEQAAGTFGAVPLGQPPTKTHRCADGSLGVADFLGWSKEGEPVTYGMDETDKKVLAALAVDIVDTLKDRKTARRGCV